MTVRPLNPKILVLRGRLLGIRAGINERIVVIESWLTFINLE